MDQKRSQCRQLKNVKYRNDESYIQKFLCLLKDVKDGYQYCKFKGQYWICITCHNSIMKNKYPSGNMKKLGLKNEPIPELPELSQLENHLIKLIIPFQRVGHCPRSSTLKVQGPMIAFEADVKQTEETILPIEQSIIGVELKRHIKYQGYYMAQTVNIDHVKKWFQYLKEHNNLFKDVEWSDEKLKVMTDEILQSVKQ